MSDPQESTNERLTYEYTKSAVEIVNKNIDSLNTKLGAVLALSVGLMRFSDGLPDLSTVVTTPNLELEFRCYWCLFYKILNYILLIVAVGLSLWGLSPNISGKIALPGELLQEKWNNIPEKDYMYGLSLFMEENLLDFDRVRIQKSSRLKWAVIAVSAAAITLGLDTLWGLLLPLLENS
jgi:hypothetical protein